MIRETDFGRTFQTQAMRTKNEEPNHFVHTGGIAMTGMNAHPVSCSTKNQKCIEITYPIAKKITFGPRSQLSSSYIDWISFHKHPKSMEQIRHTRCWTSQNTVNSTYLQFLRNSQQNAELWQHPLTPVQQNGRINKTYHKTIVFLVVSISTWFTRHQWHRRGKWALNIHYYNKEPISANNNESVDLYDKRAFCYAPHDGQWLFIKS